MIKTFFENISYRMCGENDLSDITWALCYTSPLFKETFLKFFFPDIHISDDIEIEREVAKDDSRPDFVIHNNGELLLIENKINDRNQHFGQYDAAFKVTPERFGYIANYVIPQPDKNKIYKIRTWEDFYELLETVKAEDEQEQSLIEGYRLYLRNVCNIIEFTEPMKIEGIYSLYQFIEILSKLCKRDENHYTLEIYNVDRIFDNSHCGHRATGINFELTYKDRSIRQTWGWVGIYFDKTTPEICIGFNNAENWGKPVCNIIKKNLDEWAEGKFCSKPYLEDNAYWFTFIDGHDRYGQHFDTLSLKEQTDQLKSFMDEVFETIYNMKKANK